MTEEKLDVKIVSKDQKFWEEALDRTERELKRLHLEFVAQQAIYAEIKIKLDNLKDD